MPDNTNIGGTMQNNNTNSNIELKPDKLMSIIYERKNELEKACSLLKSEIEKSPKGCLRISASRGSTQYYHKTTSKNPVVKYIPKSDINLVYLLAQKNYDQKLMKELNKELDEINQFCNNYHPEDIQKVYDNFNIHRKALITPIMLSDKDYIEQWENIEYEHMGFREETPEYYTAKGERVRSKSEIIIADELYRNQIPYKYEMPLQLQIGRKTVDFYPDFTVLNKRTGKKWWIEHFGMMDKESYFENTLQKLDIYEKNNILLGKNLFFLHETSTSPLNISTLRKYIETYLC